MGSSDTQKKAKIMQQVALEAEKARAEMAFADICIDIAAAAKAASFSTNIDTVKYPERIRSLIKALLEEEGFEVVEDSGFDSDDGHWAFFDISWKEDNL